MSFVVEPILYPDSAPTGERPPTRDKPPSKPKKKVHPKRSKGSENIVNPPLPKATGPGPRPQNLSTVPTPPKNEPMFSDLDTMGYSGVSPYRRANDFALTFEGFIPLVEREYDILALDGQFSKRVCKSAFVYYCTQHLYARMVSILRDRGESSHMEESFENQVLSKNHSLPAPIESYIKAIGNVMDSGSLRYHLRFPVWPLETGHFGRVGVNTHWMYASLPCPIVIAQRLQKDLESTTNAAVRDWNLDDTLRPVEAGAGLPTRNLLGWARASPLTQDQVSFLNSVNITEDDFPVKYRQFYFNADLFEKISLSVDETGAKYKIAPQVPVPATGSQALCCWTEVEPTVPPTSRNQFYAEARNVRTVTSTEMEARLTLASLMLCYRVRKDEIGNLRPYSVYDFGDYANVPIEYHNTRNHIFEYGRADRWNVCEFTSAFTDKSEYRYAWLKRHKK